MAGYPETAPNTIRWPTVVQFVVQSAVLALGLALVLTTQLLPSRYQFNQNDVVTFNIKSPYKVTYTSQIATKAERDRAAAAVSEVTEFDSGVANQQLRRADEQLRQIADVRKQSAPTDQKLRSLNAIAGFSASNAAARDVLQESDTQWLLTSVEIKRLLSFVMSERFTEGQIAEIVRRLPGLVEPQFTGDRRLLVAEIVGGLIKPTLQVDADATTAAREAARSAVQPVRVTVEKGEIILRDGDVVKDTDIEKLEQVGLSNPTTNWNDVAGNAVLAILVALLLASYLYLFQPTTWSNSRRLMLVYAMILIGLLAAKLTIPGRDLWAYLFPVAAVPMLIAVLLDVHLSVAVLAVFAPLVGLVSGGSLELTTAALVGGLVGLLGIWRMERQAAAFAAGVGVALATFLVIVSFKLMTQDLELGQLALVGAVCLVNGGLSTVITLGASTVLGHIFGVTTTPGLLELAHPSQPLFRRLLTQAPGTYHHSVVVANLAERAAQLVGADSLLARVGSYYHDIGKVARPYCFVENQFEGENVHDKLNPQMSAKLVTAHVKDGLQLAKQHGLPSKIRDIIEQHHGTKVAKYFYHQACKGGCDKDFDDSDFRYPGPRPQSKEAALVMLADSVEAAVRSSDDHSLENITRVVTRIVNETLVEGQLDECDLSIRDLQTTKKAFINVMQGIFHPRVKYPETDALGGEAQASGAAVEGGGALPALRESTVPELPMSGEARGETGGNP